MKRQRGFIKVPTTGELLTFLACVAGFFMALGAGLMWLVPKVWAWLKPILHSVTA